jgi:hypothetical protein
MSQSKLSVREALKMLHPNAADRVKSTRWYAFAMILDHALYDGDIADKKKGLSMPAGIGIAGIDDSTVDLRRVLRELMHECEAQALVEATK